MIPHHRQAILMSDMVAAHDASPDVKARAEKINRRRPQRSRP
ncbi:DUF305 domain-containing protein [Streptomyces sp. NPDC058734]